VKSYLLDTPLGGRFVIILFGYFVVIVFYIMAGVALSIHTENKTEYYCGTESGYIFKCSINNASNIESIKKGEKGLIHMKYFYNTHFDHM
jgi:hypothetical protein